MSLLRLKYKNTSPYPFERKTNGSAGYDLYCVNVNQVLDYNKVHTGIFLQIPKGYAGFVSLRSSAGAQGYSLLNSVGVIDSDYRGEIILLLNKAPQIGERIAQIVIQKVETPELDLVDELDSTERGEGGFGSTGKN